MPSPNHLLLLFFLGMCAGCLRADRTLTAHRLAENPGPALHRWKEELLSSWKYEPYTMTAIYLHILSMSLLSLASLGAAVNSPAFPGVLFPTDITQVFLTWIAEGGSLTFIGYLLGTSIAYPLSKLRRSTVHLSVNEEGILRGGMLLPWRWFSHFTIDPGSGILRLYSVFAPDLPALTSKPPEALDPTMLRGTLQKYLSNHPPVGKRAWFRSRYMLVPTMIATCLPWVALGWFFNRLPRELALFLCAVSMMLLARFGVAVITWFGFGIKKLPPEASAASI
jgi:hypothetical protein